MQRDLETLQELLIRYEDVYDYEDYREEYSESMFQN